MGFQNTILGDPSSWRIGGPNIIRLMNGFPYTTYFSYTSIQINNYQTFTPIDLVNEITIDQWGINLSAKGVGGTQDALVALYQRNNNMLPYGNPILGLDAAPAIDLINSPVGQDMANFAAPITIPPGNYYLSITTSTTGVITTYASIGYIASNDSRLGMTTGNPSISGIVWGNAPALPGPITTANLANMYGGISWAVFLRQIA